MVQIGTKKFFSEADIEERNKLIQRAINLLTDPEKYEKFAESMDQTISEFEKVHGENKKVSHLIKLC
jgi:hypothetical protein